MITLPSWFTYVYIVITILFLLHCVINGYKNGFIVTLFDIVGLVLAIYISYILSTSFARYFGLIKVDSSILNPSNDTLLGTILSTAVDYLVNLAVWFIVLFIVFMILLAIIRPLFKKISKIPFLGELNKVLGILLGIVEAIIFVHFLAWFVSLPLFNNGYTLYEQTPLIYITDVTRNFLPTFDNSIKENKLFLDLTNGVADFSEYSSEQINNLLEKYSNK